ncbi:MAG: hypothetical protein JWM62_2039, partial [Frankiales bacterium]|nr:hypothetical protein [Frankiales bacterium]
MRERRRQAGGDRTGGWQTARVPTSSEPRSLASRLRRTAGARLDELAVRRLGTLATRQATGQPVPDSLAPGVAKAFGAVAATAPDA